MMDTDNDGTISKEEFDSFWMQLRLKLNEDQVIGKMNDFYQKFSRLDPTKAVPDFPQTPAAQPKQRNNTIAEVNENQEEEVKQAVPVVLTAEDLAEQERRRQESQEF